MAILLIDSDTLILHVPKTGGNWLEHALPRSGIAIRVFREDGRNGHGTLKHYGNHHNVTACFVRHPVEWYRSYWTYRQSKKWLPAFSEDEICQSDNFDDFVRKRLKYCCGEVSSMFESYAGSIENPIDFIGKQESILSDTIQLLNLVNENFDQVELRSIPRINESGPKPRWNLELRESVVCSERRALDRFGYHDRGPDL